MRRSALALGLLAAGGALAQPYDPAFRWRTIDTPHFRVHHHQGEEDLAQQVAREAERAHAHLAPLLRFEPRQRTQIVLSDDVDLANGSATPLPYDTIRLWAVPPPSLSVLHDYRDWVRQLVLHEYTHILHLDDVGGIPAAANRIFGKLWIPNGLVPLWMIEGLAVVNESGGDRAAGRNGSALYDMYARALATDGPFPGLDRASNPMLDWPLGDTPYLLGGRFMGYLQARYGPDAVAGFVADQGARVWPYSPSGTGRPWFGGRSFPELWAEYAAAERAYAEGRRAFVRSRKVTEPVRLTRAGGEIANPRFSPDGSFVAYFRRDLDRAPGIFRVAPDGRDLGRVDVVDANGTLAVRTPAEAVVAMGEVFREFRLYDDLWSVDLRTGRRSRLGRGERATDPDVSRDGRTAVYVRRTGGGSMALVRRTLDGGEPEVLYAHGGAQVFMPRIAADGRVAFELQEGGRRDIAVWQDGRVTKVTDDDALDTGPAWTPDGRFLLFASDRGGIFDLYAWESATGAVRQVTNVESGALQPEPSPDGRTIVFVTYSRAGYDLAAIPFDEATWLDPIAPPEARPAEQSPPGAPLPSRPYRALDTLGPTFWLPLPGVDGAGTTIGALTAGQDVLLRHAWALQAWWSPKAKEPGYLAAYQGGWSWPLLDLSSGRTIEQSPGPPDRLDAVWTYADAGATFTFTRLARALALRIGWRGIGYSSIESAAPGPVPPASRFRDGFLSEASLRATYSDARRFVRSISQEQGRTVSARLGLAAPAIGSDYEVARARAAVAQYARIPFTAHTVLALRLAGGAAHGTLGDRAPFEIGGFATGDAASLVAAGPTAGPDQLRGYPAGAFGGTGFVLGNVELRVPLARPLAGRDTWPLFLRRVHGALFLDAGDAFDLPGQIALAGHRLAADRLVFGAGAELRLEVVLGYHLVTDVRLGVARGFGTLLEAWRPRDQTSGVETATVWFVGVGPSF